jgi:hypothetical protein
VNLNLTGLRIVVDTDAETVYGVARVRYLDGHQWAGTYEIERADGTSFLAPWEDCTPGPNWDVTPEEGRFTGAEFFRPNFLAGCTNRDFRLFGRSHGTVLPSDMATVRELAATVETGQSVNWFGHGANEFRDDLVITRKDDTGISMTDRKGRVTKRCDWPVTGEPEIGPQYAHEFLVDGNKLRFLRVSPKRYGKGVDDSLTLTFGRKG